MSPEPSPVTDSRVNVVLMWHMHQPQYEDVRERSFFLPWTYLHCIKDYCDMAQVIADCDGAKAVVNFSATLIEQIEEYNRQFDAYFSHGTPFGDALLRTLASADFPKDLKVREQIIAQCTRANGKNLIQRYPRFSLLVDMAHDALKATGKIAYLSENYFFDLLVWYHLAWMGETIKLNNRDCQQLLKKEGAYSFEDRQQLLKIIASIIRDIIPAYRRLWEDGRIELTFTPENHPIIPLMLDFHKARETIPDAPLPPGRYPGGVDRANTQVAKGVTIFEQHFGHRPIGCWPAEGALCDETLSMLMRHDIQWTASGAGVLHHSLNASRDPEGCIHHAYRFGDMDIRCFFRDDNLSDLIGFTFHDWNADDAVNHLVHHIENIHTACGNKPEIIVPIILDGENCWEYYPANGHAFLRALYTKLASHPRINLTTFRDYLQKNFATNHLSTLMAGSWVNGNLATWIGDRDKNRGWELLVGAKQIYDQVYTMLSPEQQQIAERQLSICESSDWFWWFGDYNARESVSDFDRLYRQHLKNLYHAMGMTVPELLEQAVSVGHGNPEMDGTMRRGSG